MSKRLMSVLTVLCVLAIAGTAQAGIVIEELDADADSHIYRSGGNNPGKTTNYGAATGLNVNGFANWWSNTYIRFDLSGIQDSIVGATLKLNTTTTANITCNVYGLNDGSTDGLGENWGEMVIHSDNAPASSKGVPSAPLAAETTLLGSFSALNASISFSTNVLGFLNSDTNNLVTFILRDPVDHSITASFASKEHLTVEGPILELQLDAPMPIPEPAGLGLIGLALLALRKRRS